MDRKEQIEFKSLTFKIIDNKIIYILKVIIDGKEIQCNIQSKLREDYEFKINKKYYKKIIKGMIKERYKIKWIENNK